MALSKQAQTTQRATLGRGISLKDAITLLRAGGLILYPTETVYGIGCILEPGPVARLKARKGRDKNKPILIAVHSVSAISRYAHLDKRTEKFLRKVLPGPVSILLKPKKSVPPGITGKSGLVGIRVPENREARLLAKACSAITSTSANLSGEPPAATFSQALGNSLGLAAVVRGKCKYKKPSTLFDPTTGKVLREGAYPATKLLKLWNASVIRN